MRGYVLLLYVLLSVSSAASAGIVTATTDISKTKDMKKEKNLLVELNFIIIKHLLPPTIIISLIGIFAISIYEISTYIFNLFS